MQTLIDKVQVANTENIETVGFETLLVVIANGTSGAANYDGTKEEADKLKNQIIVNLKDNVADQATSNLADQYMKVRTIAGTKNAILEAVLTKAIVASITLPENHTSVVNLLTLPANSQV